MKTKRMMMVDIETLDTVRTSVVIQVSAIVFDMNDHGEWDEVHAIDKYLPIEPQVRANRTVSASTVAFWMGESNHAVLAQILKETYDSGEVYNWRLDDLKADLNSFDCDEYWFQGPTFDAVILEDLLGSTVPWRFFQVRDQRTADGLAICQDTIKEMKKAINHDALEDVQNQINRLSFCKAERHYHG